MQIPDEEDTDHEEDDIEDAIRSHLSGQPEQVVDDILDDMFDNGRTDGFMELTDDQQSAIMANELANELDSNLDVFAIHLKDDLGRNFTSKDINKLAKYLNEEWGMHPFDMSGLTKEELNHYVKDMNVATRQNKRARNDQEQDEYHQRAIDMLRDAMQHEHVEPFLNYFKTVEEGTFKQLVERPILFRDAYTRFLEYTKQKPRRKYRGGSNGFHTLEIKVPAELIVLTKAGKPQIKQTLTKMGNISKYHKQATIKLIPEPVDNKVELARLVRANQVQIDRAKADKKRRESLPVPAGVGALQDEAKVIKFLEDLEDDFPLMTMTEILTDLKKEVAIVDKKKVKEIIKVFARDYLRKLENEQMALNDVRAPRPMSNVDRLRAENEAEIDTIQVKVNWDGKKTYTLTYSVGNKVLKTVEYPEKSIPRDNAEKWVKQHGKQLREKYNVIPLSRLKIQII